MSHRKSIWSYKQPTLAQTVHSRYTAYASPHILLFFHKLNMLLQNIGILFKAVILSDNGVVSVILYSFRLLPNLLFRLKIKTDSITLIIYRLFILISVSHKPKLSLVYNLNASTIILRMWLQVKRVYKFAGHKDKNNYQQIQ